MADSGEELYPAEAMLALLEAYRLTGDARHLESVERGFAHYKRDYYDRGRVQTDLLVFFAGSTHPRGDLSWPHQLQWEIRRELTCRPLLREG